MQAQNIIRSAVLHLLSRESQLARVDAGDRAAYCLMLRISDKVAANA